MAKKRIEDKLPPENAQISLASYWPTRPFIPHEKNTKLFTTQGVKSCLVDGYGNPQGTVDLLETHEKKKKKGTVQRRYQPVSSSSCLNHNFKSRSNLKKNTMFLRKIHSFRQTNPNIFPF